jgi:hypothetical protein
VENKALTRKDFILLTFTLIGSTAVAGSACDDEDVTTGAGGTSGGGTGRGGTTGSAGSGTGTAGSGGTTGTAGSGGSTGAGGTGNLSSCPGAQLPDNTGHVHTVAVPPSTLTSTSTQMFDTSLADGHLHTISLTGAQLATLASRTGVTVTSSVVNGHLHMYMVTCQ